MASLSHESGSGFADRGLRLALMCFSLMVQPMFCFFVFVQLYGEMNKGVAIEAIGYGKRGSKSELDGRKRRENTQRNL